MSYTCVCCKESPYVERDVPATIQLCGFWLCKTCHEQTQKMDMAVWRLRHLAMAGISDGIYYAIWGRRR